MAKKIFFLLLLFSNFYATTTISSIILLGVLISIIYKHINFKQPFTKPILYFYITYFLSFIPAYFIHQQSPIDSLIVSYQYLCLLFFFVLTAFKANEYQCEKVLHYMAITTSIVYIVQFILLQKGISFLGLSENKMEAGYDSRFRMVCSGIFSLGLFFYFNKFLIYGSKKYMLYLLVCTIPLVIQAYRTQWVAAFIGILIILYYTNKGSAVKLLKYLFITSISIIVLFQTPLVQDRITNMYERQKTESFSNKDYIRITTFNYLNQKYFQSPIEYILGSGPDNPSTKYGKQIVTLQESGIHFDDLGLYGMAFKIGPITILILIFLSIRNIFLRKDKKYIYIMVWYIFMILISFTNAEFFRPGNFLIHGLALYIANLRYKKHIATKYEKKPITQIS